MAQLNTRGTLTRSRWDYFEHSNGVASIYGFVTSGPIGAYFANNSAGATAIDVYTITWSASVAGLFEIALFLPPLVLVPLVPTESNVFALAPDVATPPGVAGMYTAISSQQKNYVRYEGPIANAQLAPIMGTYFATLPPGWAIALGTPGSSNPCELSMTVWYQYVTDNISPAP